MKTITVNERTKAGKTLLDLASLLASNNDGVVIESVVKKATPKVELTAKQHKFINRLRNLKRDVDSGNFKGQSAQSFLNEL